MRSLKAVVVLLLSLCETRLAAHDDQESVRYLFYDVNPGEGFNLRRDVYMRMAVLVRTLNEMKSGKFVLVLPPWGRLWHWQSRQLGPQTQIQWKQFFDLASLARFVPVMDMDGYLATNDPVLDDVLYLQVYKEGWTPPHFEEKFHYRDCIDPPRYRKEEGSDLYTGWFWDYPQFRSKNFSCLSVQGKATVLKEHLLELPGTRVMLDRGEQLLHVRFGDENYWSARRSMRFSRRLVGVADEFRATELASTDDGDGTRLHDNWEEQQPKTRSATGGPYLCLHLRRNDYARARRKDIPSVEGAAEQVAKKLLRDAKDVKKVFLATDGTKQEVQDFTEKLRELVTDVHVTKYEPTQEELEEFGDGGVAIIDQSICSHARLFVGSPESTFSFRIQEEREIMGFPTQTTFNKLCPEGEFDCKSTKWEIRYPTDGKFKLYHDEF